MYRTFWFLQHNFGSIIVATTCRTNTGHVTRTNCYKPEALLTTYSCEKVERSQIVVFAHYSLQRDRQSVPELLNSLFMCLCVSIGLKIFRCDHFRSINDMLLYIGFGSIQLQVNPSFIIICHYCLTLYVTRSVVLRWKESRGLSTCMT